ncbi:TYR1 [Candida oxycetoniae]|uniref:Prephenate dehydrogenase [NADP(+)] n=1 Tax=Candida oxycetoniae TaxID=497107 RepID=A0AAI9WW97_9ASCO|nr:TYR1 [Candida oxycetoniae]KAI3402723.1 TYR1 [Candida oxycetoniae]
MMTINERRDESESFKKSKVIGIIGLGDMGLLYARRFSEAGWKVIGCDREELYEELVSKYKEEKFGLKRNGHLVSRESDYIIYSVEAENIDKIVATYGPSSKYGAIVGGQTSCKAPEIEAFEKHLPSDTQIISLHSLHGPKVNTTGQPLVVIRHRSTDESLRFVKSLVSCLNSKLVELTAKEHDRITADTQAVTHAAFLSMGVAWRTCNQYPWKTPKWIGGIENAKINISLRIYSNKWHVYAGLAITNPSAHDQVIQYSKSTTELFTLMIQGKKDELNQRLQKVKKFLFHHINDHNLLLDDSVLEKFSLNKTPPEGKQPNSHLSLLAIADSWYNLGIVPYDHIICSTPLFRIFLGVTEYVFCTPGLLEESIEVAATDSTFRQDDLHFTIASETWAKIIKFGNFQLYREEFNKTQAFFQPMLQEANAIGNEMIKTILERVKERETWEEAKQK